MWRGPRRAIMPTFCNPTPIVSGPPSPATRADPAYKTFWAMVIADKSTKRKDRKATVSGGIDTSENAIDTVKNFVCKYLC